MIPIKVKNHPFVLVVELCLRGFSVRSRSKIYIRSLSISRKICVLGLECLFLFQHPSCHAIDGGTRGKGSICVRVEIVLASCVISLISHILQYFVSIVLMIISHTGKVMLSKPLKKCYVSIEQIDLLEVCK